ncbi:unnamed protein product [Protopolystoma xenopodis]|uniref:Uncharacterized protein n=1 Tax=Protopolystoma xenopodis TaxID=117903 RepID=A0A448X169_9PLAT|nr:unnamed protein product [Protopolystoma xenopodis]
MPDRSLDDLISDQVITDATEEAEMVGDDEGLGQETHSLAIGDGDGDRSSTDTEDARWNGEAGELGPDADDEELDNDYCQAYFDNGEGDFSDDGLGGYTVGGEDGGGGRGDQGDYYE